jgi:glucose-6-phosphate dehydrogenase assembly protein OpcA
MSTTSALPAFVPEDSTPVALRDVEAELSRRLKEAQGTSDAPVQRARMSNLVVFCDSVALAETVAAQIADIIAIHPARVFLLVAEPADGAGEETAFVSVRERPAGGGRVAYNEQITLHATGRSIERLPFAVRGLVVGHLPTNLWWAAPTPPSLAGPLLHDLAEHAEQVLYDSIGWTQPARGVAATASWIEGFEHPVQKGQRCLVASDLNWRRLKSWRRVLGQALDPATAEGALESITEVQIEHGPHAVVQAWLLGSWLASCLHWEVQAGTIRPNVEFAWSARGAHGPVRVRIDRLAEGPSEIRHVRIACRLGATASALDIGVEDDRRLAVRLEGIDAAPRTITRIAQPTAELVGRQLSDRERDPAFCAAMTVAGALAQRLMG